MGIGTIVYFVDLVVEELVIEGKEVLERRSSTSYTTIWQHVQQLKIL